MFRNIISTAVASFMLATPVTAETVLTGPEIEELLSGATLKARARNGRTYTVKYTAEGAAKFQMDDYSFSDKGRWSIDGDASCSQWEEIRDGAKACWSVIHRGDDDYLFRPMDGGREVKASVTKD